MVRADQIRAAGASANSWAASRPIRARTSEGPEDKEQYFLDKPSSPTHARLDRDDVEEKLEVIARNMSGAVLGEAQAVSSASRRPRCSPARQRRVLRDSGGAERARPHGGATRRDSTAHAERAPRERDPIRPERPPQGRIRDAEDRVGLGQRHRPCARLDRDRLHLPHPAPDADADAAERVAWRRRRLLGRSARSRRPTLGRVSTDGAEYIHPGLIAAVLPRGSAALQNAQRHHP